jgi:hypothetical protein
MSYNVTPHYARELLLKNRLDELLKPLMGKFSERNAPGYLRNDSRRRRQREPQSVHFLPWKREACRQTADQQAYILMGYFQGLLHCPPQWRDN